MLKLYYNRKDRTEKSIKDWLLRQEIDFMELPMSELNLSELKKLLALCEDGFDNILAYQSRAYQELYHETGNLIDLNLQAFLWLLLDHPMVFKNGILVDFDKGQLTIGYKEDDIRTFVPKNKRRLARVMRGVDIYGYRLYQPAPAGPVQSKRRENERVR